MVNQVKKRTVDGREINEIDINKVLKDKKKQEILEIYSAETGLPICLLEQVWTFCETTPEKKLKQIKKGQYKNKTFTPNRPFFENGQVLEACNVRELTEEELNNTGKILIPIEDEETEKKIEELNVD